MDNGACPSGTRLLPSVEPVPVSPADAAAIPSAVIDAVAAIIDPCIAKLTDKVFTGGHLLSALRYEQDRRSVAVAAIDMYHGFTCEFSPWPTAHAEQYDMLEELLVFADAVTNGLTSVDAYLNAKPGERLAMFFLAEDLASAIEARRAETAKTDSVHESAGPKGDAQGNPS